MQTQSEHQVCEELITALRVQRHDFINHLQVVHAMLQLGRVEKALGYIDNLAKNPDLVSDYVCKHQKTCE